MDFRALGVAVAAASMYLFWTTGSGYISSTYGELDEQVQRMAGVSLTYNNPNDLAMQLCLVLPVLFALFLTERKWWHRLLLIGSLMTILLAIVLTGSRGGLLQLAALLGIVVLQSSQRRVLIPALLVLGIGILLFSPASLIQRYSSLGTILSSPKEADPAAEGRLAGWNIAWQIFQDRPILGVGAGNFPRAFERVYSYKGTQRWAQAHNLPGQVIGELGLVGAIAFTVYVFVVWRDSVLLLKDLGPPNGTPDLLGATAHSVPWMLVALLAGGLSNHLMYFIQWYIAGACVVVAKRLAKQRAGEAATITKQSESSPTEPGNSRHSRGLRYEERGLQTQKRP